MSQFQFHDETSAPAGSQNTLSGNNKAYGFIPNLLGAFAENPAVLDAYLGLSAAFDKTGLTATERQIVAIASSVENDCHFCVAAHTTIAQGQKVPADVLTALRTNTPIADAKLEALRRFTLQVVRQRGFVADADVQRFREAGYDNAAILAVVVGVSLKTFSNYANHFLETPVNEQFAANAWTPAEAGKTPVAAE